MTHYVYEQPHSIGGQETTMENADLPLREEEGKCELAVSGATSSRFFQKLVLRDRPLGAS